MSDTMTLREWCSRYGWSYDYLTSESGELGSKSVPVPVTVGEPGFSELGNLSDYWRGSVVAGTTWMVPKG